MQMGRGGSRPPSPPHQPAASLSGLQLCGLHRVHVEVPHSTTSLFSWSEEQRGDLPFPAPDQQGLALQGSGDGWRRHFPPGPCSSPLLRLQGLALYLQADGRDSLSVLQRSRGAQKCSG